MLNVYQAYTLELLRQLRYLRCDQLAALMRLRFGSSEAHVERNLRQLRYMGRLEREGDCVRLPGRPRDEQLLWAVDVMLQLCGGTLPDLAAGEPPCKLVFSLQDERGYLDFKAVPVKPGEERPALARLLAQSPGFSCTFLFLLQSEAQIPLLETDRPAYYVLPNGKGGYSFLKKHS